MHHTSVLHYTSLAANIQEIVSFAYLVMVTNTFAHATTLDWYLENPKNGLVFPQKTFFAMRLRIVGEIEDHNVVFHAERHGKDPNSIKVDFVTFSCLPYSR